VAPLGPLHQLCVHGGAVQLLTAVPQVALTDTFLASHSDCPEGGVGFCMAAEGVVARRRSGSMSLQNVGLPNTQPCEQANCC
jgi:hypothetical protein